MNSFDNITFEERDFTPKLERGTYEGCIFRRCNFLSSDLSGIKFLECEFVECDMSMAKLSDTVFQDTSFEKCKQLGLRFDQCSKMLLSFTFKYCVLDFACFSGLKVKKTSFKNCQMKEVDFSGADISGAVFDESDLARAVFDNTTMENADFRKALNFSINLEHNKVKKARFSLEGLPGLLGQYDLRIE